MCGQTKAEADFAFDNMAKGTRQRHCRKCQAAYRRAHYLANREEYIRREAARIKKYRLENRALMLAYLLDHPCVDCGRTNPVMLDFDHRDPALKRGNVSELAARQPWRLVLREIAKCDVRCANCHLKRTAQQFRWRKVNNVPLTSGKWVHRRLVLTEPGGHASLDHAGETKTCTGCGQARPIAEFPFKDRKRSTRKTHCRSCRSAYGRTHYDKNREAYIARAKSRPKRHDRSTYWSWLMTYLESHPCIDCGETDPIVLQFDHRDDTLKVDTIGTMINRASWATLLAEIAKCDVRCANCHRRRTAEQFGWAKLQERSA
ncbi:MAG: hypothetical protein ABJB39_06460 [Chloroflexota bacterium]